MKNCKSAFWLTLQALHGHASLPARKIIVGVPRQGCAHGLAIAEALDHLLHMKKLHAPPRLA